MSGLSCLAQHGPFLLEASSFVDSSNPGGPLYRIGWGTKPWEFPDWLRAGRDASSGAHTFGNRFDDPDAQYVLYAASQLVSCYVETLARFRPDFKLLEELDAMEGDNDFQQIGLVPDEWNRLLARYQVEGGSGLAHKGRGRESNRSLNLGIRKHTVELVRTHYVDFGPTLATESLRSDMVFVWGVRRCDAG